MLTEKNMKEMLGVRLSFDQKRMLEHVMKKQNLKTPSDALRYSLEVAYKKEINRNLPEVQDKDDIGIIKRNMQNLFLIMLEIMSETDAKVSIMNDVFITKKDQKLSVRDIKHLIKKYADEKFSSAYNQLDRLEW